MRVQDNRAVLEAQIAELERRQVARYAARDALSELIERRQHEIEVLKERLQ